MPNLTDAELRTAMKAIATLNGLPLADDRLDRDLPQYKALLAAAERIQRVELPIELEPAIKVTLEP